MTIETDTSYAPELLIFRLTSWPSEQELIELYGRLTSEGTLASHTSALIDARACDFRPPLTPQGMAATFQVGGGPKRRALLVQDEDQRKFCGQLEDFLSLNLEVQCFLTERDALSWLFPQTKAFPLSFLD